MAVSEVLRKFSRSKTSKQRKKPLQYSYTIYERTTTVVLFFHMLLPIYDKGGNGTVSQNHDSLKYSLFLIEMIIGKKKVLKAQFLRTSGTNYSSQSFSSHCI